MQTAQHPIGSGYDAFTTAAYVIDGIDLTGKVAIVTGGYSGLGLETARQLARAGAQVIVPARSVDRARAQTAGISGLSVRPMDLIDRGSIDDFVQAFLATGKPLHLLINSAGVMRLPLVRDASGNEGQFAINHLGHFRLTQQLLPALERAGGARVVSVSSRGHFSAPVDFEDPGFHRRAYDPGIAYGQSKSANALFALGLDTRVRDRGIRAFSLHPGAIFTDLMRYAPSQALVQHGIIDEAGKPLIDPANDRKSVAQGAATQVWCAVSPQLNGMGGVYCEDCDIAWPCPAQSPIQRGVKPWACDLDLAERLWTLSESLVGR